AQLAKSVQTPDQLWGPLFEEIQLKKIFPDNKTFVDAVPKASPAIILTKYHEQKAADTAFELLHFVTENFTIPIAPTVPVKAGLSLKAHLEDLWNVLRRNADVKQEYSSLLPLPKPYIVPGGRFREIYYWDSYFTMQGLAASNRYDLIENMIDNFASLITTYGHIPNGNRSYYLSRSQPPYFALMVALLAEKKGDVIYKKYFSALQKEYAWWMQTSGKPMRAGDAWRRVVKLDDSTVLNRNWDDKHAPREESYVQDVTTAKEYKGTDSLVYTHLRAGAESGWDFSSRWFADTMHLATIETTNLIPVDLNCLLYAYEKILSKAATVTGKPAQAFQYKTAATQRQKAILNYCWNNNEGYFFDFDFKEGHTSDKWSAAGVMPLFVNLATKAQAAAVEKAVAQKFLKDGGIVTTLYHTGQQWDAPNGWAPLQFLAVKGLLNYNYATTAETIATRWMALNEKVFAGTGKMLEKYNVENITLESGGGEYPTQDGFGWSNGVYLKFYELFRSNGKALN
ncbi:MAG TPA: alpha,alpha-trehalase TreA, partial [Chitinophagaceae bacterium]|nr:alpha,alpha-trehalase TreA [Chitinophagaceae bacterium]